MNRMYRMHYPGAGWIRISASQSSNKYKQQESLANAEVNARQPWYDAIH